VCSGKGGITQSSYGTYSGEPSAFPPLESSAAQSIIRSAVAFSSAAPEARNAAYRFRELLAYFSLVFLLDSLGKLVIDS
jgi:hypothetical protein